MRRKGMPDGEHCIPLMCYLSFPGVAVSSLAEISIPVVALEEIAVACRHFRSRVSRIETSEATTNFVVDD